MPARTLVLCLLALALPAGAEPVPVVVSVLPQKCVVDAIGGERVVTRVVVGPGQSHAAYEPTPRQMVELSRARVYFRIGMSFEPGWLERVRATNPAIEVIDQRKGLPLRPDPAGHAHEDEHGEPLGAYAGNDPHVWTSPALLERMASQVHAVLTRLDPAGAPAYAGRLEAWRAALAALDQEIRRTLAGLQTRTFLVYHPAWGYFAETYGLQQVAIEHEGKEPGARSLAAIIEGARRAGVQTVLVQRQFPAASAEAVARAIGARLVVLDPLAEDCLGSLRAVAQALAGGGG